MQRPEVGLERVRRGLLAVIRRAWNAGGPPAAFDVSYSTRLPLELLEQGNEVDVFKFAVQYTGDCRAAHCAPPPRHKCAHHLSQMTMAARAPSLPQIFRK